MQNKTQIGQTGACDITDKEDACVRAYVRACVRSRAFLHAAAHYCMYACRQACIGARMKAGGGASWYYAILHMYVCVQVDVHVCVCVQYNATMDLNVFFM